MPWPLRHLVNWCPWSSGLKVFLKTTFHPCTPCPQILQGLPRVQKIKVNSKNGKSKPPTDGTGPQVTFPIITQLLNLTWYLVNVQNIHFAHTGLPLLLTPVLQMVVTNSAQEPTPLNNLCECGHTSFASISYGFAPAAQGRTARSSEARRPRAKWDNPRTVLRRVPG